MITLRFYRIYDIGREIDLDWLEKALAQNYFTARTSFVRVKPKSIMLEDPPLMIQMNPIRVERDGRPFEFFVVARVYDIGVISFCFIYENLDAEIAELEEIAFLFAGQEGLADFYVQYLKTLGEIIRPHIKGFAINPDFYEDYSIYVTDHRDDSIDPVALLIGEKTNLSPQIREEILKNSLSYTTDDLAILSWDSALLCNPDRPTDLIEFANVQVLELRYYDRELTREMEKMYDDIEHADRMSQFRRGRQYHAIMAKLMQTSAEISEIIEKVDNLIKVTEDVYYARVYATALKVLRSSQWSESVSRKIEVIQENYSMLSGEVRIQHSNFLEWVVIILIALELVLAIWLTLR
jgi:ribosome-binding factor A